MAKTAAGGVSATTALLLCCLLFLPASAPLRADPPADRQPIAVFERAEFVLSDARTAPDDRAPWQFTALPHEWRHTHPGKEGTGWYRIRFDLPHAPATARAIMIAHARSNGFTVFVNGSLLGGSGTFTSGAG